MNEKLNCLGKPCPIPVVESKKRLAELPADATLEVSVDGDIQVQNLQRLAKNSDCEAEAFAEDGHFVVRFRKGAGYRVDETPEQAYENCALPAQQKVVVVISSDEVGRGNEELGHILMKSFFFALTQQDTPISTIIFYNGGVRLVCEGSPVLEDLKTLEQNGALILACGTCLDFYKLKEQRLIGEVANMYDIQEAQLKAGKILKP